MNAIDTHLTQLLHKYWTTTKTLKTRNSTDKMSPEQIAPNNKLPQEGHVRWASPPLVIKPKSK